RKGLETLAQAVPVILKRCPDASVRFIGADGVDPKGRSWRLNILDSVSLEDQRRVAFEQISRADLADRYGQASLCVVPSPWENFPYSALEAMACGTPVVATRAGGLPELVEHGRSGVLTTPG